LLSSKSSLTVNTIAIGLADLCLIVCHVVLHFLSGWIAPKDNGG
jgi:hypothetical protein